MKREEESLEAISTAKKGHNVKLGYSRYILAGRLMSGFSILAAELAQKGGCGNDAVSENKNSGSGALHVVIR
jgi:hypothetical protein